MALIGVWARTALFTAVFYPATLAFVLLVPVPALLGARALRGWAHAWALVHRWAARAILGISVRVEGRRPAGPALYAVKHQAMFETLELVLLLDGPAVVLKRELARIPLWGWAARRYGMIAVDRRGSAAGLRAMLRDAAAARAAGRSVVIFPEGTRVAPGETPPLKPGFAGLYRALALPAVPVAVDSGLVWPRRGPKRPGVVTVRFGEPIAPGLPRRAVEALVHQGINALEASPADQPR